MGEFKLPTSNERVIRVPKCIAKIRLCGAIIFRIDDTMPFVKPTEEQIKNLHDMLCIDVELLEVE